MLSCRLAVLAVLPVLLGCQGSAAEQNGTEYSKHVPLTRFGKRLRNVVIAAVEYEGVCASDRFGSVSWRGMLPRYLATVLRPEASVIVWNGRKAAREKSFKNDCELCRGDVPIDQTKHAFSCHEWFQESLGGTAHADLVIVVGTGMKARCSGCRKQLDKIGPYGELKLGLLQPWVGRKTKTIHLPISRASSVLENQVARFNKVLPDETWVKPVHFSQVSTLRQGCQGHNKTNSLVYVAPLNEMKGQLQFLKLVDPHLLKGYTIRFFGTGGSAEQEEQAKDIAKARGINVEIQSSQVPREEIFAAMCSARGAIHYAKSDANPRVLYESLTANLPVLITAESRFPDVVRSQPFVFGVQFGDKQQLHDAMSRFMSVVRGQQSRALIEAFVEKELNEDIALRNVCAMMGICKERKHEPQEM